ALGVNLVDVFRAGAQLEAGAADGVHIDDVGQVVDVGEDKSSWWVVPALMAVANGTRLTPELPARSSSLARSWTHFVTSVSAGPPLVGLYLKPPSSGGLCDGVMTMPSARRLTPAPLPPVERVDKRPRL